MIILTVKIKGEATAFTKKEFLADNYNVCKDNKDLEKLVEGVVKESRIQDIQDVIITAKFEW